MSQARWPLHTDRIKLIKRMPYGYRDSEFFFMKIKNAFLGNP
ncbi:Mobile element protein [Pseudomonas chlororaphis subsp. aurantiaca]|nr:Mobile element protein [Pseudomonas chlororaphis subsp. aurantiaca]AZD42834.1 Mobile element protein [Pseudomonas chlororaphis subsp. aurantiaca]